MTFAQKKKKDLLLRMVENWKNDILHKGNLQFERYGFGKLDESLTMGSESGPIWLGHRLSSSRSPVDYHILVYEKGAYVLHMLRMMMKDFNKGGDERFLAMMQDFVKTYTWKNATTEDFRRVAEKHMGMNLKWFFDQWVYGTAVPTYSFKWRTEPGPGGKTVLILDVKQSGVPDQFKMPIPFHLDFGKDRYAIIRQVVDAPSKTFRVNLPAKPRNVEFNFYNSVLCYRK